MATVSGRRAKLGFSLIELLIVIAIIAILLGVALPSLIKGSTFAREVAASKAISTIHTAETQYFAQFGRYASSLEQLGPSPGGTQTAEHADLIDQQLANGNKEGFRFTLAAGPDGYVITAMPAQFGISGRYTYFSDQSMAIHRHSGPEPATINDPLAGAEDNH